MKNSTKKILALVIFPVAVLIFSGCSQQAKNAPSAEKVTSQQQESKTVTEPKKSDQTTTTELPDLPTDNRQAIDSELNGIDQALQETDKSLSTDEVDSELGL